MKFLFLLLSCLVLSLPSIGISADKEMHIFLLIGQSNMAGRAKLKPGDDTTISNCKLWNGKSWEEAKAPFNRYATIKKGGFTQGMNPGPEFVKAYQKANPNVQVGIINWARGGSSIEQWDPGKNLYQSAVKQTKSALKLGGKLKGILWHQGESNSKKAAQYPKLLKAHVERLRKEFSAPNLPFVFGQIGEWNKGYKDFNEMIVKQTSNIPNTACISSKGLTKMDAFHFNHESQLEMGKRYAKEMLKLLK